MQALPSAARPVLGSTVHTLPVPVSVTLLMTLHRARGPNNEVVRNRHRVGGLYGQWSERVLGSPLVDWSCPRAWLGSLQASSLQIVVAAGAGGGYRGQSLMKTHTL
ncbi:hypothetical protein SRHO_G00173890 [Serrasalmus rhombeus]